MLVTLLVFLWGAVSLAVDPLRPFAIPDLFQVLSCAALLVYFVRAWHRPDRRIAEGVSAALIAYALVLTPWTIVAWCRLGRPVDAFFVPQIAAVSVALIFPGRWWLGVTAMALFVAQSVFAIVYTRYLGLPIPTTEPFATFAFATLGTGLFILRRRRRSLAHRYVQVRAEIDALARVRPLFLRARKELDHQLAVLAAERGTNGSDQSEPTPVRRALDRLDDLRSKLAGLAAPDSGGASTGDAERQLLAHDAQLGALLLAGVAAAVGIPAWLTASAYLGEIPGPMLAEFVSAFAICAYLIATLRRPSSSRALWAVLALFATQLVTIMYDDYWLLGLNRPYTPLLGHKVLMGVLGLTLATRFKLGVVLILVTALNAIALFFAYDIGAHEDIIPLGEPVTTLIYALIGLASLRMLEQRQIASLQLLRAETEVSAMHRRAVLFLALRDRLNSPLETLVLGVSPPLATGRYERAGVAVDRLVTLSRELAELDVLVPDSTSMDADRELHRQL